MLSFFQEKTNYGDVIEMKRKTVCLLILCISVLMFTACRTTVTDSDVWGIGTSTGISFKSETTQKPSFLISLSNTNVFQQVKKNGELTPLTMLHISFTFKPSKTIETDTSVIYYPLYWAGDIVEGPAYNIPLGDDKLRLTLGWGFFEHVVSYGNSVIGFGAGGAASFRVLMSDTMTVGLSAYAGLRLIDFYTVYVERQNSYGTEWKSRLFSGLNGGVYLTIGFKPKNKETI